MTIRSQTNVLQEVVRDGDLSHWLSELSDRELQALLNALVDEYGARKAAR